MRLATYTIALSVLLGGCPARKPEETPRPSLPPTFGTSPGLPQPTGVDAPGTGTPADPSPLVPVLGAPDEPPGSKAAGSKGAGSQGTGDGPVRAKPAPGAPAETERLLTEQVGGFALVRLPVRGFEALPLRERILAYHLYQASLAGRDITFDQNHRLALAIRHDLEQVLTHKSGLPQDLMRRIREYAKLFWISNGPYHERTKRKLVPAFSAGEWEAATARAKQAGAQLMTEADLPVVRRLLFEPGFQPVGTAKSPPPGMDILTASGNNLYDGVSLSDLAGFEERYPTNSRLVKRDGNLVEDVWRAGRPATDDRRPSPPGGYAKELRDVCRHIEAAIPFAGDAQKETLRLLVEHFETGSPGAFDKSSIAWLRDDPRVDLILGFIETYKDARGVKGEWEGIVSIVDAEATRLMQAIAGSAQYFEDRAPWDDDYKKKGVVVPVAKAIQVIAGHGGGGPSLPAGVNLPNSEAIREEHGSKSFLLTNVLRAIDRAVADVALDEFALPHEREAARRYGPLIADIEVALHEIVGHGSGKLSARLAGKDPAIFLREHTNALEEARAELVALHHIFDPRMREIAPECDELCAETALRGYVRQDLTLLRRVGGDRIEDDHMRATHLIVQYAASKGAVRLERHAEQTFQVVADVPGMRQAVSELLTRVMRIKAEGDYDEAKELFERFGTRFDPDLRDEVRRRASRAGLPDFYAFVMPELHVTRDGQGAITDVQLEEQGDFEAQMLRWSRRSER